MLYCTPPTGDDVSNREGLDEQEEDSTLWEQMTAREERDAARRAGMRAGDWQTERQLQEALRESRMVKRSAAAVDYRVILPPKAIPALKVFSRNLNVRCI